ncbi:MAG: kelch repeat-containing protein [Myxococcota bacterium]
MSKKILLSLAFLTPALGCGGATQVDVQLVDPCNKPVLSSVDFLKFEPRGTNLNSRDLSTITAVADKSAAPIKFQLAPDFQLVVTGHKESFDAPASAAGVSAKYDLLNAKGPVSIRIPLAPIDEFTKTTKLDDPKQCSAMAIARYGATASWVPQIGRVIIIGGATVANQQIDFKRTIEAYDPASGLFEPVAELPFGGQRAFHTATVLNDGRILIVGGEALINRARESLKSALIVDARDLTKVSVSATASLRAARTGHTAVRLADGRVMILGGRQLNGAATRPQDHIYLNSLEIFDPERNLFVVPTGMNALENGRYGHSMSLLKTGKDILVAGGFNENGPVRKFEIVHLEADAATLVTTTATTGAGPIFHAASVADDGRVLISGGYGAIADAEPSGTLPANPSSAVEMWEYNDASKVLRRACTADLSQARGFHTVNISGRRAIFIGGRSVRGDTMTSAEVATLTTDARCFAAAPALKDMADDRAQHVSVALGTGEILVVGGLKQGVADTVWTSIAGVEVFSPAREF